MSQEHLQSFLEPERDRTAENLAIAFLSLSGTALIFGSAVTLPLRSPVRPVLTTLGVASNAVALAMCVAQFRREEFESVREEKRIEFARQAAEVDFATAFAPAGNSPPSSPKKALAPTNAPALPPALKLFNWSLFDREPDKYAHLAIVGATGDGKNTLVEGLCRTVFKGQTLAIAPHYKPGDFPGIPVFCTGRNYGTNDDEELAWIDIESGYEKSPTVAQFVKALAQEVDRRYQCRERGDETYQFINIVWDETLASLDAVPELSTENRTLLREARKVKIRLIELIQDDAVKSLKIEGQGAVRRNLTYVRLGSFAKAHVAKLQNQKLLSQVEVEWLYRQEFPCIVEDAIARFPSVSPEFHIGSTSVPPGTTGTTTPEPRGTTQNQTSQRFAEPRGTGYGNRPEPPGTTPTSPRNQIQTLLNQGYSKTKIIKDIWGMKGRRYQEGLDLFDSIMESDD